MSSPLVAIHQPNYLPWLGYFNKINMADIFVFLDDVQFSKGSYTNRVQIISRERPRWLSVPVRVSFGDKIQEIYPANPHWPSEHLRILEQTYGPAPAFREVWPSISKIIQAQKTEDLASINIRLVCDMARHLGLRCDFRRSSTLQVASSADERLVEIIQKIAPGGTYLSGKGGAKYQNPNRFREAGLGFLYSNYSPAVYPQNAGSHTGTFMHGLSVLDAVFHLGWEATSNLAKANCH